MAILDVTVAILDVREREREIYCIQTLGKPILTVDMRGGRGEWRGYITITDTFNLGWFSWNIVNNPFPYIFLEFW